jgi:hypothetical protein
MEAYKECLEAATLWGLRENFSKEKGGCINNESDLKVEITFDAFQRRRRRHIGEDVLEEKS